MKNLDIIKINTILFFCGWILILLAGADFPPPPGFIWLIILTIILDYIQYEYLKYFLPRLIEKEKNIFFKNLFYFSLGGMLVSLFTLIMRLDLTLRMGLLNILIWICVLTLVGFIYSICFYIFNTLLLKFSYIHKK